MSHRITTTSSSFDDILAGFTDAQHEAITARHCALLDAIEARKHAAVSAILAEPSPVPLVHVTFGTPNGTSGLTALYGAVMYGNTAAVRLLLEAGASLQVETIMLGNGPFTLIDCARMALSNPHLSRALKKDIKDAIRLLEQAADARGEDAETMQASVKKRGRTVVVEVVNKYSRDVLTYGRARGASDRAMSMPSVMHRVVELMTGEKPGKNTMVMAVPIEAMKGGATLH
ncbi:hypothetical protein PCE31106_00101 [Pandoraea cepalis]|uniref:Uncharacterized protein n=1 Tax=Pandoraea cepalis TaxID=2508294 RepID=A0A5E4RCV4_9BURK|nr:ankyrin repeat domain-containing protein [Pandoraea cepalis]VVD61130.1 hypothetical protein PCE31106_00101 [Pandoraea cepalis]